MHGGVATVAASCEALGYSSAGRAWFQRFRGAFMARSLRVRGQPWSQPAPLLHEVRPSSLALNAQSRGVRKSQCRGVRSCQLPVAGCRLPVVCCSRDSKAGARSNKQDFAVGVFQQCRVEQRQRQTERIGNRALRRIYSHRPAHFASFNPGLRCTSNTLTTTVAAGTTGRSRTGAYMRCYREHS